MKKFIMLNLLWLLTSLAVAEGNTNNPMINSRAASNQIFTEHDKLIFNDANLRHASQKEELNRPTVNPMLASNVTFTSHNELNNNVNTKIIQSDNGRNNSMINSNLASSVIFTDQQKLTS